MKNNKIPMNLQIFAESGADGNGSEQGTTETIENTPMSFDEFLKGEGNQAEFDRRVSKAINTAKEKWDAIKNDELSEAEKLAKMTKAERSDYEAQKRSDALDQREKDIVRKELQAEAKNTLLEKKLPAELASILDYSDAEKCKESIESVEKAFNSAVELAVNARIKGSEGLKETKNKEVKDTQMEQAIASIMGRH